MPPDSHTSGDLLADRRFEYGRLLAADGDHAAAADLYRQALERVPEWPAGWLALGSALAEAGDDAAAAAAFERLAGLDPDDRYGGRLRLAALGHAPAPDAAPAAYVRELFDDYAGRFETALVERLDYRAPALIAAAIAEAAPGRRFGTVLDLGCGTGLMAEALASAALLAPDAAVEGVDLSPAMLAEAGAKGLYTELRAGEIVDDLATHAGPACDLVVAADVFVYLGDLSPVFAGIAARLAPGGLVAFSVEAAEPADDEAPAATPGWRLGPSLRYAHAAAYVRRVARDAGLRPLSIARHALRRDRGEPVDGHVAVFARGDAPSPRS